MLASETTVPPELAIAIRDNAGPIDTGATFDGVRRGRRMPYHPIISDGLMRAYEARGWVSARGELGPEAAYWPILAPLVEDLWNRHAHGTRPPCTLAIPHVPAEIVEQTLGLAEVGEVRSFGQGIEAATDYLLASNGARLEVLASRVAGESIELRRIEQLTITAIKEGQTSGILQVRIAIADREPVQLALNVARDLSAAAAKLRAIASDLRVWHRRDAACAARVLDEDAGYIQWFGERRRVPIVATEWVDGDELHVTRCGDGARLHRVREFVQGASAIPAIRGDVLDGDDARAAIAAIADTRTRLATFTCDGVAERMFDINRGDAVLRAGPADRIALIGSAAWSWCGALGAWPYRLAATATRDEECDERRSLLLDHVEDAVAAGCAAMRCCTADLVEPMIDEALASEPEDAFPSDLSNDDRAQIVRRVRAQLALELGSLR